MKKLFLIIALVASSFVANAFEFDGIDLNNPYANVTREIAKRGYTYDHDRNCLTGNCQGMKIFLSINYVDVKTSGMLGQLIVDIPASGSVEQAYENYISLLNVVYHQVPDGEVQPTYLVDKDGTKLNIYKKADSIELIYSTPYYKKPVEK